MIEGDLTLQFSSTTFLVVQSFCRMRSYFEIIGGAKQKHNIATAFDRKNPPQFTMVIITILMTKVFASNNYLLVILPPAKLFKLHNLSFLVKA